MFQDFQPTRAELLIRKGGLPGQLGPLLAGTARSLRLSHKSEAPGEKTVRRIAADILAPLTFLFVAWVLDEARKKNLSRLYFLARDGQVMYRVARELATHRAPGIELRYLYCSREALCHIPPTGLETFDLDWLTRGHLGAINLAEIAARLGCPPSELSALLTEHGFTIGKSVDSALGWDEIQALRNIFSRQEIADPLARMGAERRRLACRYLDQEGVLENADVGLVDTGWKGTSQYALARLLRSAADDAGVPTPRLHGFYLGVGRDAWGAGNNMCGFLFDEPRGIAAPALRNFPCIEMLFSGRHGRVAGYFADEERVHPRLASTFEGTLAKFIRIHHAVAVSLARRLAPLVCGESIPREPASRLCRRLIHDFVTRPAADVAHVYGSWPMGFELRERDFGEMAPPVGFASLSACVIGRKTYTGFWPQGSFVRGGIGILCPAYNMFQSLGGVDVIRRLLETGR